MTRFLAWLVHLYTALGLLCAAAMAVLIIRGGDASFRSTFLLMMVATAIDATDAVATLTCLFALIGLANLYLDRRRPRVRYLADSAYWIYLSHMPAVALMIGLLAGENRGKRMVKV